MNAILEIVVNNRKGNYCHALEVSDVYELEIVIESIYGEFIETQSKEVIIEFFNTMELYCLEDENEDEIFNFNIANFINSL